MGKVLPGTEKSHATGFGDTVICRAFEAGAKITRPCLAQSSVNFSGTVRSFTAGKRTCRLRCHQKRGYPLPWCSTTCSVPRAWYSSAMFRILLTGLVLLVCPVLAAEDVEALRKAAKQGDTTAQFELGVLYNDGEAITQDHNLARYWWHLSAEQGNAPAQNNLGFMYEQGVGAPKDFDKALHWYHKAAEQGHDQAQANLGMMYGSGDDVPQDYVKALYWLEKGAEQENALAKSGLDYLLLNPTIQKIKAAQKGGADAQAFLGAMYIRGKGVPEDYAEGAHWLRKAAEQGNARAQISLGFMYEEGAGVPQLYEEAARWLQKAAENGSVDAQFGLGKLYAKYGTGIGDDSKLLPGSTSLLHKVMSRRKSSGE